MFMVCVGLVFARKKQFYIICLLQHSISINTTKVDPHSDSLHNSIVKPKNIRISTCSDVARVIVSGGAKCERRRRELSQGGPGACSPGKF